MSAALPRPDPAQPGASQPDQQIVVGGRQLLARIKALPSVVSASVASDIPLDGGGNAIFYSAEGQSIADAQTRPRAYIHRVSPDFFATLQAKFTAGRTFTEQEMGGRAGVAIVTENLARRFWPGQDPIGKRFKGGAANSDSPWWTIVGVVGDMKYRGVPNNPTADPDVFLPFSERQRNIAILVRTSLDPKDLSGAVRAAIREVDPAIPVYNIATMSERVSRSIARSRFAGWAMTLFAALALALASIGLYGVMAYNVSRRTRELGVRIAVGASPHRVVGIVLGRGIGLAGVGLAIGMLGALGLARLLGTMLYGVRSR